jgi:hypothetical protein
MTAISSGVDWGDVFKTLGSTTVVIAVLGFIGKATINQFFRRDVETHKANLKREADLALADAKARLDLELAATRARTDAALLEQKANFDKQMEAFKTDLATNTARADRIREDIERWANPILGSVMELQGRLDNILKEEGHLALTPVAQDRINREWSITYEYFLPSTVFLFSQYFCWVRLLEETLSFELLRSMPIKMLFSKRYKPSATR